MRSVRYVRPKLYEAQERAIFCEERYSWIEASTKSGKTHGCIIWLHEQAALYGFPGANFWWVAPIFGQAKIAYRRLCKALPPGTFTKNETELSVTLANGAVMWFKSADKPDSLYGEDVHAAVIDEASRVKHDSWVAVRSTLTATKGPIRIIGNVKGKRNWAYRGARRAEQGNPGHHFARLSAYDAVAGGVIAREEVEQAKNDLPPSVFRELYLALPPEDGDAYFATDRILIVDSVPSHLRKARGWDLASTEVKPGKDPDWTVGSLLGHTEEHTYVMDVVRKRVAPDGVFKTLLECSLMDGPDTEVVIEQEPGSSGKIAIEAMTQHLRAVPKTGRVHAVPISGDKITRAFGLSVRINQGKLSLVKGDWNDDFLAEFDEFPPDSGHDDIIDATAHSFNFLSPNNRPRVRILQ